MAAMPLKEVDRAEIAHQRERARRRDGQVPSFEREFPEAFVQNSLGTRFLL
jgi:hypothetical protein